MTQIEIDSMLTGKEIESLLFLVSDAGSFSLAPLAQKLGVPRESAKAIMLSAANKLQARLSDDQGKMANLPENNIQPILGAFRDVYDAGGEQ
jgi:hypothetical protein